MSSNNETTNVSRFRSVSDVSDTSFNSEEEMAKVTPTPSVDGNDSPKTVYDCAVINDLTTRREAMVWREDSGEKLKVPLLPKELASTKLRLDITKEGNQFITIASLNYRLVHSLIHLFIYLFIYSFIYCCIHTFCN